MIFEYFYILKISYKVSIITEFKSLILYHKNLLCCKTILKKNLEINDRSRWVCTECLVTCWVMGGAAGKNHTLKI